MQQHFVFIDGPNLNLVGTREPHIYGSEPIEPFIRLLQHQHPELHITYKQSNHEGTIIDWLHQYGFDSDGIILNAGAYTHYSIAIRDAIAAITTPVVEVHISDTKQREAFRRASLIAEVCTHSIMGKGISGYKEALDYFLED